MIIPKPYELYSYYENKEVYVVVSKGWSNNIGSVVTLRELNSENPENIVVPIIMFNEELPQSEEQRYAYSRVDLAPISHNPRQTLSVIPTAELVAELNTREGYYGIDRSSVVSHYYDLGVIFPDFDDNSPNFIKRKEAQTKEQMLQTLQAMTLEAETCGGKPVVVRHHIVVEVIDPESETPI